RLRVRAPDDGTRRPNRWFVVRLLRPAPDLRHLFSCLAGILQHKRDEGEHDG
ncbi:Os11g0584200, partial [Oryza sativa Japonica Group]